MNVILIISIIFFSLAAYFLITPITIWIKIVYDGRVNGVAGIRIYPFPEKSLMLKPGKKSIKPVAVKLTKKKSNGIKFDIIKFIMADWETIQKSLVETGQFFIRLIKSPYNYRLSLSLDGGLYQPDRTGQLYGAVCAIKPLLPLPIAVAFKPDFEAEQLVGEINAMATFRLIKLMKETIVYGYRLPKWRLWKLSKVARKD